MRALLLSLPILWFSSCSSSDAGPSDDAARMAVADSTIEISLPIGVYLGTTPCADCPGIATRLWLRVDSTYLMIAREEGGDPIGLGTFGTLRLRGDEILLKGTPGMRFKITTGGLMLVAHEGDGLSSSAPTELLPTKGDLLDKPMRITGTYTYAEESHAFRPCGADQDIPLGIQNAGLEMAMWFSEGDHSATKPLLVEIQAHLGLGPSMEGDEEEEYLYVDKVLRKLNGSCPAVTFPL